MTLLNILYIHTDNRYSSALQVIGWNLEREMPLNRKGGVSMAVDYHSGGVRISI
jgi:hypothetical protein